ncbi:hypothetical protein SAMN05216481_11499 [Streptomyces radiopugnans]|uniref:Uncharacterized protein n=1 Tax=Streptomyces radiopugnans TaxID=403935 RepID=A0A1H9ILB1_9ACTN|nr:hypothetical protein SAMN05216481_11499 [Streptomyces radiopugnans]
MRIRSGKAVHGAAGGAVTRHALAVAEAAPTAPTVLYASGAARLLASGRAATDLREKRLDGNYSLRE